MIMRKFGIYILLVLFSSCHQVNDSNGNIEKIFLDVSASGDIKLSEITDTVEIIPLEQTDESDIARIERIIPYKDKYFLLNTVGFVNGRVLVFDREGNFINKIDKRGSGPDEYIDLKDIALDFRREELIFMTQPNGIYRYDMQGNFICKVDGGYGPALAVDGDGNFYRTNRCDNDTPNRLLFINKNESVAFGNVEPKDYIRVNQHSFTNEFESYNDRVFYSYPCCDSIFEVTKGRKIPYLYIDYCGLNLPVDKIFAENRNMSELRKYKERYTECFRTDIFQITDKFLYVGSVDGEKNAVMSLYSFETGKTLSARRLIDDIFFPNNVFKFRPFRMPIEVEEDCLLWLVEPSWLLNGYDFFKNNLSEEEWDKFTKKHSKIVEICSKLNEESNPVLIRIKIKDF